MSDRADTDRILAEWSAKLSAELGIGELPTSIESVLDLASVAAHSVVRPAAPLTTFLVGYAAGLAAARDGENASAAVADAAAVAARLAESQSE